MFNPINVNKQTNTQQSQVYTLLELRNALLEVVHGRHELADLRHKVWKLGHGHLRKGAPDPIVAGDWRRVRTYPPNHRAAALKEAAPPKHHGHVQLKLVVPDERIARQLHDSVIQELFATAMALQAIQATSDDEDAQRIARIVEGIDATSKTIRSVIFDLSSPIHSEHGLRSSATALVGELAGLLGFEPRCQFAGPLDTAVPDSLVDDALAVLREALTNVARHAHATAVDIRIEVADDLSVEVIDNGAGLPEGTTRHSGLANLTARARQRRGRFSAYTAPGGGTALEWVVPVVADPDDA